MLKKIVNLKQLNKYAAPLVGLITLLYYSLLAAREWTWIFVSGDSGDWIAASRWWIVPQPFGSPLYIMLGHLINFFYPQHLIALMTLLLSVVPAAITVTLVFLTVRQLTHKLHLALLATLCLLGAGVFLSQATVLEEYSIAIMFTVAGYYFYLQEKRLLTVIMLGLGTAVHIAVPMICLIWLAMDKTNFKKWLKVIPVYILTGGLPYLLIAYLFEHTQFAMIAGGSLSLSAINSYLGAAFVVGTLSINAAPMRILTITAFILSNLGVLAIAAITAFKGKKEQWRKLLLASSIFVIWYFGTSLDPTTWTYLAYAMPMLVILGITELSKWHKKWRVFTFASAAMLVILNSGLLNANTLSKQYPVARQYEQAINEIPDNSAVVIYRGGWEALGFMKAITEGKQFIPLYLGSSNIEHDALYDDYKTWLNGKYSIEGNSCQEMTQYCLTQNIPVYKLNNLLPGWEEKFTSIPFNARFSLVTDVDLTELENDVTLGH